MSRLPLALAAVAFLALPVARAETPAVDAKPAPDSVPPKAESAKPDTTAPETTKAPPDDHKLAPAALNHLRVLSIAFADESNAVPYAARLGYALDSAVRQSKRFEAADGAARLDPAGAQDRAEAAQKGADALAFGLKAYGELQDGLGLEWFDRAIGAYKESALWEKDNIRGYARAVVMRIIVKWSDDPGNTRREIANLLNVDPKMELPRDLNPAPPQDLAQEFQRLRESMLQAQPMSLDVATRPLGARVYLDGVYKGTTPNSIQKVSVGEHLVSILSPGYEVVQKAVRITPGDTINETLKQTDEGRQMANLIERVRKNWGAPEELEAEKKLATLAGVDELLMTRVRRESGQLQISAHRYRGSDGHHEGCLDLPPQNESDPQWLHATSDSVGHSLAPTEDAPFCDGRPCACRATFNSPNLPAVIATGVSAAVLLAGGITLAVVAKVKADAFVRLPQTTPGLRDVKGKEVLTYAIPADVCTGLGLVSAGVWAYLAFGTSYARHAEWQTVTPDSTPPPSKSPASDDPFSSRTEPTGPGLAFSVAPQPGGVALSLMGGF